MKPQSGENLNSASDMASELDQLLQEVDDGKFSVSMFV